MLRTFILPVIPVLILSCGGQESAANSSAVVNIPLEESGGAAPASASRAGEGTTESSSNFASGAVATPPASHTLDSVQAQPASALVLQPGSFVAKLDAWHRALEEERSALLRNDGSLSTELRGFAGIFTGSADVYRASLSNHSSDAFGPDFQRYANAWASSGLQALRAALASGPVGTAKMVWTDALMELSLATDDYQTAGASLTTVIADMLAAGYARERVLELTKQVNLVGRNAAMFLPATDYVVTGGDSYWKICRKFRDQGLIAPRGWIAEFNHKSNYSLRADEALKIPTAKLELRAWRQSRLMVLYADGVPIRIYPVSMGKAAKPTPLGAFTFGVELLEEPIYYPAGGSPVPYANPDNPLGERWMGFEEDRQYGIHGTNSEETIGSFESGGCIRMHNADAKELFELIAAGVKVTIYA
jgi:lipoprotein-anchoring transpeptidase ErfK/SrfK